MSVQDIVFYLGIAAFVVAGVFLALAAHTFFAQDIRGVMADLSGQARVGARTGSTQATGRGRGSTRSRRPSRRRYEGLASQEVPQEAPPGQGVGVPNTTSEDGIDTILDTALREAHRNAMGISNDSRYINDDMPTLVTSIAEYPQQVGMQTGDSTEAPTAVEGAGSTSSGSFRISRSIVAISSNEVISVSEE